uniref:Uncharacterized protein n=1 Tax=Brassica oleracea TaxID=3712 RepID=A0A3P6G3M7_BRAOL|nr:unnamed protein product [Brassica oleracea]
MATTCELQREHDRCSQLQSRTRSRSAEREQYGRMWRQRIG